MGPRVQGRWCILASALLALLLAPSAVSSPFQVLSSAAAQAKVLKDPPGRPLPPVDQAPIDPAPEPVPVPTEPVAPPAPDLPPAPETPPAPAPPPADSTPAPAPVPAPEPPASDSAPAPTASTPAQSVPTAPSDSGRTGPSRSPRRGPVFSGGASAPRLPSGSGGEAPAPVTGTAQPSTAAGLGVFPAERRGRGDDPIAALGFDGWGGMSPGVAAAGGPGAARSGVKGVTASGGGIADSDRSGADRSGSGGTLVPFVQHSSGGLLIVLGLLLALALLVRHELPRR